ncbi:5-Enolpyruvylshikimate-3-phosphate synthase [Candidatus Methanomethylophilus alvi Mx1201]|uniref:3-phosphoshikimate 1-carboxyvinyltransferase n=2 Tax=Methanomethylophilus alvi TaxID=1291540 RepID=M9SA76_METAX|nr:3-phosphoshikimate 1-carboxyvinyltransferase [Methanomethylophilus alvi]AGI85256.1 5-Enolpyruvylshikimate-3-phosphate synthase [Candidatus Methanomethylophilus alvi Mx1201]AYQ54680.1 3-phosphoshikimate 1-carboxyvinyltransferase [Methanomethylophilus alvi]
MSDIVFRGGRAEGKVSPPPSKSHTHRAIIMSALSEGRCEVSSPLISFDTRATMDAVRAMGAVVTEREGSVTVECESIHAPDRTIDVMNSGTTMRLMTGISSLFSEKVVLTGDSSIQKRPMGPLLDSLSAAGVECSSNGGKPPVEVRGPITGSELVIDGGVSSQFVSSLIMSSPLTGRPTDVRITGHLVSKPYIDITTSMMGKFGVEVTEEGNVFHAEPQHYMPTDYRVPADFSSSAFPLVAGGIAGRVTARGMDMSDPQGDRKIIDVLKEAGCDVEVSGDEVTCSNTGRLEGAEIDMGDIPDLFPVVAVLLSTAKGRSRLYGAPHLRFKESDRIALTENMLRTLGADIRGTEDGCVIEGVERLHGGRIEHNGDHRMMMAAAVASLVSDGPVSMENDACWNVSYPGFPEQMRSIGMDIEGL